MKTVVSLLNGSRRPGIPFPPELLQRMDSLYAFYHQQWWCYRKMLNHYKCINALFNGMALLLMAAGMIAGPLLDNSTLVACLAAVGTVVKGWNDFKQYRFKVTMSRFAFTTYAKALTELKTYVRGVPLEDLEGFLIKMQTLDDTIVDFTPPLPKRCVQALKGITDNVQHYRRRQRGGGWWSDLKRNTRQGYKETQDLIKQNKALQRVLSHSWYP